jgi:sulfite reductase beta subunit-like hemoprotein
MENILNILADLANELDNNQAHRLADKVTIQLRKASEDDDHEYDMVRNQMETAERAIDGIEDVIGDEGEGNLMAWVQSKITNAVEMLDGVSDYLQSQHKTASDKNKGKKLNKPFRTPGGPKKFSVYVKNDKGNIVKVNFGDPGLSIKRDNPARRKNFRARHNCDNPGPKWKARYWSCRNWEAGRSVSDNLKGK